MFKVAATTVPSLTSKARAFPVSVIPLRVAIVPAATVAVTTPVVHPEDVFASATVSALPSASPEIVKLSFPNPVIVKEKLPL